jgi:hypothetical protein
MFSSVNIQDELLKIRQKHAQAQYSLMQQANESIKKGEAVDEFLMKRIRKGAKPGKLNTDTEKLDKNKVFSEDDIKSICVQYRLRFLDSKYFNPAEIPQEALTEVSNLENDLGNKVSDVKIVATAKQFKREDKDISPIMFARLDDENFYLVYKWGKEFSGYKKVIVYPLRSILTLLISLLVVVLPFMLIIPAIIFRTPEQVQYYQMLYLAAFTIGTVFILVFGGFTFYKKFSRVCWNKPYLN